MVVNVKREKCIYCGGCVSVCPESALELKGDYIEADEKKCINCGKCVRFCPAGALWL